VIFFLKAKSVAWFPECHPPYYFIWFFFKCPIRRVFAWWIPFFFNLSTHPGNVSPVLGQVNVNSSKWSQKSLFKPIFLIIVFQIELNDLQLSSFKFTFDYLNDICSEILDLRFCLIGRIGPIPIHVQVKLVPKCCVKSLKCLVQNSKTKKTESLKTSSSKFICQYFKS